MLGYSFREIQKFTYRFLGEVENPKARQNRTDMYNRKPQPEELEDGKKNKKSQTDNGGKNTLFSITLHSIQYMHILNLTTKSKIFSNIQLCTMNIYNSSKKKKKERKKNRCNNPTNSNTNYRREMKLVPMNMDHYLF